MKIQLTDLDRSWITAEVNNENFGEGEVEISMDVEGWDCDNDEAKPFDIDIKSILHGEGGKTKSFLMGMLISEPDLNLLIDSLSALRNFYNSTKLT